MSEHTLTTLGGVTQAIKSRAPAMAPDDRRDAIAAATLTLLLEHGSNVTTRQIADAAGIAEGTIFRAFADKDAVIRAAVDRAFDPAPTDEAFAAIDLSLPLERRVQQAVVVLQERMRDITRLVNALGGPTVFGNRERQPLPYANLARVFEPDQDQLRCQPPRAAQLLTGLTLAFSHPAVTGDQPVDPHEIVRFFLDGIRA